MSNHLSLVCWFGGVNAGYKIYELERGISSTNSGDSIFVETFSGTSLLLIGITSTNLCMLKSRPKPISKVLVSEGASQRRGMSDKIVLSP